MVTGHVASAPVTSMRCYEANRNTVAAMRSAREHFRCRPATGRRQEHRSRGWRRLHDSGTQHEGTPSTATCGEGFGVPWATVVMGFVEQAVLKCFELKRIGTDP